MKPTKPAQMPGAIAPPETAQPTTPDVQTQPPTDPYNAIGNVLRGAPTLPQPRRNWTINDVTRTSRGIKNASPVFRSAALVFARDGEVVAIFTIANLVSAVSDAPAQTTQPEGGAA